MNIKTLLFLGIVWFPSLLLGQSPTAQYPSPNEFISMSKEPQLLNLGEMLDSLRFSPITSEVEGKVIVRILFDEKGKYIRHIVLKDSQHPLLTKMFTDQINLLRVKPGEIDGRAVAAWITIRFDPHSPY